ncbi:MAG: glycosyltransferase family 39 protein [Gemmatimonadetes bacterium]|nr:glycosyltransferase family 39 protein [Gemmatimonadota bacterium]
MTTPGRSGGTPRWAPWALLALTLLAACGRFPFLTAQDLWFDEVFSVVLASQDLAELLRRALADQTNPPGFYVALWAWIHAGGVEESWIRALPALAGTLTIPLVVLLGRALGQRWGTALTGGLLAAASPLLLAMSVEVRAYAPLALLTTGSLLLAVRLRVAGGRAPRRAGLALALVDGALVLLHYFGALVVLARIVAAFVDSRAEDPAVRRHVRTLAMVTGLPAALLLAAWFAVVLAASTGGAVGGNASWIPAPGTDAFLGFGSLVVGTFGSPAASWAVALALLAATVVAGRRPYAAWLIVPFALPLLIVLAAGAATGRSLWVGRYLVVALPAALLLLAGLTAELGRSLPRPWRAATAALLSAWAVAAGGIALFDGPAKPPWSRIVPALAAGGPVTVCVNEPYVGLPLQYHAVRARVPVRVAELRECAPGGGRAWVMLRPGTEASLAPLRERGARFGPARALGTELPPVLLQRLEWAPEQPPEQPPE